MRTQQDQTKVYQRSLHRALWAKVVGEVSCEICGYDKCFAALEAHHENPTEKAANISSILNGPCSHAAKDRYFKEIPKCRWVCANCHRELHADLQKVRELSGVVQRRPRWITPTPEECSQLLDKKGLLTKMEEAVVVYLSRGLSRSDVRELLGISAGALRAILCRVHKKMDKSK